MKFNISTVKYYYYDYSDVKSLESIGFKFEKENEHYLIKSDFVLTVEIKTIEELMKFIKNFGELIIGDTSIIIFNDRL